MTRLTLFAVLAPVLAPYGKLDPVKPTRAQCEAKYGMTECPYVDNAPPFWMRGGTFETPLVILSLAFLGVVSPQTLRREWRIAYMVIAGIAVFGTPDWSPVTMLLVAIPMALLYEFSLILCRIFVRPAAPQAVRET